MTDENNNIPVENETQYKCGAIQFGAVLRAFAANIGIAAIKLIGWWFTKSSAMLAESIHSGVDSFNSICLLIGLKRGTRPADEEHPYGYGLETNIWTVLASILMLLGAFVAFWGAFEKIFFNTHSDDLINNYHILALILLTSACFEGWALNSAAKAVLKESEVERTNFIVDYLKSIKYVHKITTPTTKFVWYEDTIAVTGVLIAFAAVTVAKFVTGPELAHIPDGIASMIIACMLIFMAIYMFKNNINLLTGQSAEPQTEQVIRRIANSLHGIEKVKELKTIDMGTSGILVNITIEVDPNIQVKDADDIAEMLERKIKKYVKNVSHVSVEVESDDVEENWEDKFDKIIHEGEKIDVLDNNEANMLSNFASFAQTVVDEVMVPRNKVVFADTEVDLKTLIDIIIDSGHTRIPVYQDTVDNIIGVVNAKDVLKTVRDNGLEIENFDIKTLVREILIVPENKFVSDMLSDFTSTKTQIAAVVDEHGGTAGIVTIEDIIEEIVGEIYDEFDEAPIPEIKVIDDYTLNISAQTQIEDINERFDLDIPLEDFQTIGGYVFGLLGREPEVNDVVENKNLTFKVLGLDGHVISRVLMTKTTPFTDKTKAEEEKNDDETV